MLAYDARILIVDDSPVVRIGITRLFASLGYSRIIEAADGEEAVALHASRHPDLIVLDVVMPKMRGDAALAKIRETDTATPIIMLTSVSQQSEIDRCRQLGITEYFVKPLVSSEDRARLREQLALL